MKFSSTCNFVLILFILDLTNLPALAPGCRLKVLDARGCSVNSVNLSLFRKNIKVDLRNNQISELPRRTSLQYLQDSGSFQYGKQSFIALENNPLTYPPQHIIELGTLHIIAYLQNKPNRPTVACSIV